LKNLNERIFLIERGDKGDSVLAFDKNGYPYLVTNPNSLLHKLSLFRSDKFGQTFDLTVNSAPGFGVGNIQDGTGGIVRNTCNLQVGVRTGTGHIYMVYPDDPADANDFSDIFLMRYYLTRAGWVQDGPVRVNHDATTHDQWNPTIALPPDGNRLFIGRIAGSASTSGFASNYHLPVMKNDTWTNKLKQPSSLSPPILPPFSFSLFFSSSPSKQPEVMYPGLATAGFNYCSVRFFNLDADPGAKPQHVEDLTNDQIDHVLKVQRDNGIRTASLGGRIGKVRFSGNSDNVLVKKGTEFQETGFSDYLKYCERCFEITNRLDAKLYRLFPFYAPETKKNADWEQASVDALGRIVELAGKYKLISAVETEANLIAPDGHAVARLVEKINRPELGAVFDAGNMRTIGYKVGQLAELFAAALAQGGGSRAPRVGSALCRCATSQTPAAARWPGRQAYRRGAVGGRFS
jgi:hypothetical protein